MRSLFIFQFLKIDFGGVIHRQGADRIDLLLFFGGNNERWLKTCKLNRIIRTNVLQFLELAEHFGAQSMRGGRFRAEKPSFSLCGRCLWPCAICFNRLLTASQVTSVHLIVSCTSLRSSSPRHMTARPEPVLSAV
jgi:hypothetical protein